MKKIIITLLAMFLGYDSFPQREVKLTDLDKISSLLGSTAPEFTVYDMLNNQIKLNNYNGKVVILNFWQINCGQCWDEIASLNRIKKMFGDNIEIISMLPDSKKELLERIYPISKDEYIMYRQYSGNYKIDYKVIPNASFQIKSYDVKFYPMNFIINTDGKIYKALPYIKTQSSENNEMVGNLLLEQYIQELLSK